MIKELVQLHKQYVDNVDCGTYTDIYGNNLLENYDQESFTDFMRWLDLINKK